MLKRILFIFLIALFSTPTLQAQEKELDSGRKYTIRSISVTGTQSFNEQTVIAFTGLKKGDRIHVPGEKLSQVTRKLWDQNLFSDIAFYVTDMEGDMIDLELYIVELPKLHEVTITGSGIKKSKIKEIIKDNKLNPGVKITNNLINTTRNHIVKKYQKDGFLNTKVAITTTPVIDSAGIEISQNMRIKIDRGNRVKVKRINFEGNEDFKDRQLRAAMKKTKVKNPLRFWKRSKYTEEGFTEDKESLLKKYKSNGFRDARILDDSLTIIDNKNVALDLKLEEGDKYYFGDVRFIGNSVFTDAQLREILSFKKGDVYNGILLQERIQDDSDPDADDITNLYQNNGYLAARINPVEVAVRQDTIDFEIRIMERNLFHFNHVTVVGNDRTNDHVIYRELRTLPGQTYSKRNIIRTLRELGQLGFFDPEKLSPNLQNVDENNGLVDIEYSVVEKGSSQVELQGGYGGGGFIGTLGLSFKNFSLRNIFNLKSYRPLPMGDGQTLALRVQASSYYQTYSMSLMEPWLGGKKPIQFSTSFSHTEQYLYDFYERRADRSKSFTITGASVGLAKKLKWPDDYFVWSNSLSFQHYNLNNYNTGLFTFGDGYSNNLAYTVGLSRNNTSVNPIYPLSGSKFSITAKLTLPYSAFNNVDYKSLKEERQLQEEIISDPNANSSQLVDARIRRSEIDQERFKWLEYYKVKFNGDWYTRLYDKLVLRTAGEFGFLGAYNNDRGVPPFERFFLGGDGLDAYSLDGREVVQLRGYPNQSLSHIDGNTIYNKFTLEVRYPVTLAQMASIYVLAFAEGGGSFDSFDEYNPFSLKRSAGFGVRIFMPAFGLLGIDFGYGFDPVLNRTEPNGWQTHFIIGQQF